MFRTGGDSLTNETDRLLYCSAYVLSHPDLGYSGDDFKLMALLAGGDYAVSDMLSVDTAFLLITHVLFCSV